MNKLFLFLLSISTCLLSDTTYSGTIRVGQNESAKTIKQGIVIAQPGDTLLIQPGIYKEGNILLEKSLTLLGNQYPILDGEHKYEILTIHANNVTIAGLKFMNTGVASVDDLAAVKGESCKRLTVTNNVFENNFFGIHLDNSSHALVKNNTLKAIEESDHEIGNGIHMWKCKYMTVEGNIVQGHRDGIYFEFVTNSLIINNHSEGNLRYGLHFMFSHNDEYRNNTFVNNGAGVAVMFTNGVKMIDNTFDHNWGPAAYGLLLKEIKDSFVIGNKFIKNSVGIFMEGSSRIEFKDNTFMANGYAVRLQASCDDNVFKHNNFSTNTFDLVTNGTLVLNTINSNYWDKYEGYDLNKDAVGDVPYRPVSMYSMIVEQVPTAVLLWRSFLVYLMDRAEKAIPAITPENLKDDLPSMKPYDLIYKHP